MMAADEVRGPVAVAGAQVEHAPALRALFRQANEEHRGSMPPRVFEGYLDDLLALVGDEPPPGMLVVVGPAGAVLATGTVLTDGHLQSHWPSGTAVLRAMAVEPAARGTGLGGVIGRACLARARDLGAAAVGLHTGPFMHDAMRLYESLGFRRCPELDVRIDDIFGPAGEPYDDPALAFRLDRW